MEFIIFLLVVGTAVWVGIDASSLGVQRGRLGGGWEDMSVASWVICCLLLWIVAFPGYLFARPRYVALRCDPSNAPNQSWAAPGQAARTPSASGYQAPPQHLLPAQSAPVPAPPQTSPDGRWWWDGQTWSPMPGNATSGPGFVNDPDAVTRD